MLKCKADLDDYFSYCFGYGGTVEFDETGARLTTKRCLGCPDGSQLSSTKPFTCQTCIPPQIFDISLKKCVCPGNKACGVTVTPGDDSAAALGAELGVNLQLLSQMTYHDIPVPSGTTVSSTVTSHLFSSELLPALQKCYIAGDRVSCNAVANLCVLQMYDKGTPACKAYLALVSKRQATRYHNQDGW
ncbi:hypothetical protein CBR_g17173 [Chara braunii]|uniref:Uncharacterized protein n=1 Tax=Chara braunii TaxID=69332 RepID=A0A388KUU7_CHABU|nr:hypothetical protein CBR_g17173 [Chara braunii]|eukprot:GBG73835.1 hypothetical protein CBR_g17173 [Chara braunii]